MCGTGARQLGLFDRRPRQDEVRDRVFLTEPQDERRIHHDRIYPVKRNAATHGLVWLLGELIDGRSGSAGRAGTWGNVPPRSKT